MMSCGTNNNNASSYGSRLWHVNGYAFGHGSVWTGAVSVVGTVHMTRHFNGLLTPLRTMGDDRATATYTTISSII